MTTLLIPEQFTSLIGLSFKLMIVIAIIVYLLFALLMTRQVSLMIRTLSTKYEDKIKLLTNIHLGIVVLYLVIVLVWL